MAKTIQERLIAALIARGEKEVQSNSRKYRTLTRHKSQDGFYFVGKMGALRVGRIATKSIPVSDSFKQTLLEDNK